MYLYTINILVHVYTCTVTYNNPINAHSSTVVFSVLFVYLKAPSLNLVQVVTNSTSTCSCILVVFFLCTFRYSEEQHTFRPSKYQSAKASPTVKSYSSNIKTINITVLGHLLQESGTRQLREGLNHFTLPQAEL